MHTFLYVPLLLRPLAWRSCDDGRSARALPTLSRIRSKSGHSFPDVGQLCGAEVNEFGPMLAKVVPKSSDLSRFGPSLTKHGSFERNSVQFRPGFCHTWPNSVQIAIEPEFGRQRSAEMNSMWSNGGQIRPPKLDRIRHGQIRCGHVSTAWRHAGGAWAACERHVNDAPAPDRKERQNGTTPKLREVPGPPWRTPSPVTPPRAPAVAATA